MPRFYVYALIDPRTQLPRYIGKGHSRRTEAHVRQAQALADEALVVGARTEDVWADDLDRDQDLPPAGITAKQAWLQELLAENFSHEHIARVIARDLDDRTAFTLESFLIHNVYGLTRNVDEQNSLLNIAGGRGEGRFRPEGDWADWQDPAPDNSGWYIYVLRDPTETNGNPNPSYS